MSLVHETIWYDLYFGLCLNYHFSAVLTFIMELKLFLNKVLYIIQTYLSSNFYLDTTVKKNCALSNCLVHVSNCKAPAIFSVCKARTSGQALFQTCYYYLSL